MSHPLSYTLGNQVTFVMRLRACWRNFCDWSRKLLVTAMFRTVYRKSFEYDQIIKLWLGPKLIVFLMDPRDAEMILSSHIYIDKSSEYRFFEPWLGNGLLISTGKYLSWVIFTLGPRTHNNKKIIICKKKLLYPQNT